MKKLLSSIGWNLLEYLRRAGTPFLLKLMFGMTMLASVLIKNTELRTAILALLFLADGFISFVFLRAMGEAAYKMNVVGQLRRENKPLNATINSGKYHPSKEYRPYKGFVIGLFVSLIPAVLILVGALTGSAGVRAALIILAGWAYLPAYGIYQIYADVHHYTEDMIIAGASSLWWGYLLIGIFLAVSTVAYILGGKKEKFHQFVLSRQMADIDRAGTQRSEGKGADKQ